MTMHIYSHTPSHHSCVSFVTGTMLRRTVTLTLVSLVLIEAVTLQPVTALSNVSTY